MLPFARTRQLNGSVHSENGLILPNELTKSRKNTSTKVYYRLQPLTACISGVIFDVASLIPQTCTNFLDHRNEDKGYARLPLNTSQQNISFQSLDMLTFLLSRSKIPNHPGSDSADSPVLAANPQPSAWPILPQLYRVRSIILNHAPITLTNRHKGTFAGNTVAALSTTSVGPI